ncbi:MAG: single-stranded DNA-binding protein [Siphoviridae sp. cttb18]|nr:MAG: single-stranded DNA-binding protein [Siphoviridae sp. cttb18]
MKFSEYQKVEEEYNVGGGSAGFMRLQKGDNIIRIVSEFEVRGIHGWKTKGGQYKSAICIGKEKGCKYCKADNKVSVKYLGWVINKTDKNAEKHQVQLLEIGHTVFKQLGQFQADPDYAFDSIPDYDVKIKATGDGLDREYQVLPSPKRYELDAEREEEVSKLKPISEIIQAMKDKEAKKLGEDIKVDDESEESGDDDEPKIKDIPY